MRKDMAIIVTGGCGFIGSHLAEVLAKERDVIIIDNLHTGNEKNLEGIKVKKLYKMNAGEIERVEEKEIETIFHQGCYSSSSMYRGNPFLTAKALEEFIAILEFARKKDAKVIFASTSSVYNGLKPPHKEEMHILAKDFYSDARYYMERIGKIYNEMYSLDVAALRYFSVYGEREFYKGKYANLITQFLIAGIQGKELVVYGDGEQRRDFIYVSDVVKANLLAEEYKGFGIFNIGTGKNYSLNEIIEIMERVTGMKMRKRYVPNPIKNYVMETLADTKLAREKLGFKAEVSVEEGIEKLWNYWKERKDTAMKMELSF